MPERGLGIVEVSQRDISGEPLQFGVVRAVQQSVARREAVGLYRAAFPHGPTGENAAPVSPWAGTSKGFDPPVAGESQFDSTLVPTLAGTPLEALEREAGIFGEICRDSLYEGIDAGRHLA